ncbi:hypothetical protein FOB40_00110 [Aeromonas veronii]|nr:hypothetical protein FOB40_00110 [Aeromonas veronii]
MWFTHFFLVEVRSKWYHHNNHGRLGSNQLYTNKTICTFLMLKEIFSLSLKTITGQLDSLLEWMNVLLFAPYYSGVSKCARKIK